MCLADDQVVPPLMYALLESKYEPSLLFVSNNRTTLEAKKRELILENLSNEKRVQLENAKTHIPFLRENNIEHAQSCDWSEYVTVNLVGLPKTTLERFVDDIANDSIEDFWIEEVEVL